MVSVGAVTSGADPEARGDGYLRDALSLAFLSLAVRALVVLWAKDRFPPADDGAFYHVVAQRIAHGAGYTWLWPDGAVSYAAHYPVGYPALLGVAYAVFGSRPVVAMAVNAGLGAFAVFAAQRSVARLGTRRQALIAGFLLALHPGLVFYTPALMTEGVTAELLVVALWLGVRVGSGPGFRGRLAALGLCAGAITLLRPQLLIMAPILGFFAASPREARYSLRACRALFVTGLAVAVCLPWTLRNCARMDRCVFVSANGGWNLLIGAQREANGAWIPIEGARVPAECRSVFGEAEKDRCFGRAGLRDIRQSPLAFLALIPHKLSLTFDYFGAPGHYLNASNSLEFDETRKLRLGVLETVWERLVLLLAIVRTARLRQAGWQLRLAVALPAALFAVLRAGWLGYLGWVLAVALSGKQLLKRPLTALAAGLVFSTAATHALFFGAGRYGFVCAALLCLAAVGAGEDAAGAAEGVAEVPAR
jgi:4-amino-4-deoxy-L-arabinose transferase-like glycosyltransferase